MELITSRQNSAVKFAKKLHEKKFRDTESLFLMEGTRVLNEARRIKYPIKTLFYSPEISDSSTLTLIDDLSKKASETFIVSGEIMDYISPAKTSQKILTVLEKLKWNDEEVYKNGRYFTGLYKIQDPGNLGTIIRSARAFDCGGIILIGDCVDPYNPRTVRSSAGYILSMPIITYKNFNDFIKVGKNKNFRSAALSPHGKTSFSPISAVQKTVYVLGGEASGIDKEDEEKFQEIYRIPMVADVESLNLSVSASIIMEKVYEQTL